jgi:hypothetical protein
MEEEMTARQAIVEAWRRVSPKADWKGAMKYADLMAPYAGEGLRSEVKPGFEEEMIDALVILFRKLKDNPRLAKEMLEEAEKRELDRSKNQ